MVSSAFKNHYLKLLSKMNGGNQVYRLQTREGMSGGFEYTINVYWLKPGERVRFYRTRNKTYAWLPDENEEAAVDRGWGRESEISGNEQEDNSIPDISLGVTPQANATSSRREEVVNRRDYDVEHYLNLLVTSYAARLRKAFSPSDFKQIFRLESQPGLFDQPIESIEPRWIRCQV